MRIIKDWIDSKCPYCHNDMIETVIMGIKEICHDFKKENL